MARVRGKNVIVLFNDNGDWKHYACGRSCTLDVETEMIETSIKGQGAFKTNIPVVHSFSGTIDGLVNIEKANTLSIADLQNKQLTKTMLQVRFQSTDDEGHVFSNSGNFYISKSSYTGTHNDMATFSISLIGTGVLSSLFTPTPVITSILKPMYRYEYLATTSTNTFTAPDLINKYIGEVSKDGVSYSPLITSGTPNNKGVLYEANFGKITFAQNIEAGEMVVVLYRSL